MMADLKLDYPKAYDQWNAFLAGFDLQSPLPPLPEVRDKKAEFFIAGRGVISAYYAIKNLEERLGKYSIRAPYDGVLASAFVTQGTLVRPGQNLGEFIATDAYELSLSIAPNASDFLTIGDEVSLSSRSGDRNFSGYITRINRRVDPTTQMVQVFVETKDSALKEGMYLEAEISAGFVDNALLLSRKLLVDDTSIYGVKDGVLVLVAVEPIYFMPNRMVVRGVPDGTIVLTQPVSGAHTGMRVQIFDDQGASDQNQ
jgi:multidrug efflux pump subunit AcrA (membrane-fusion protein)